MKFDYLRKHANETNTFLYLDRYVNEDSRTYSPFANKSEGDPQYHPIGGVEVFDLPCLKIPLELISVDLDNPNIQLLNRYVQGDAVLFPIHPEVYQDDKTAFIDELKKYPFSSISVSPTSSTRTVMVVEKTDLPKHFIKLHYPRAISRFIRRMRRNNVQVGIEISKDLQEFKSKQFAYFPETIGLTYGTTSDAWGCIIREYTPRPSLNHNRFFIPLFAFYSKDCKNKSDLPLLVQLVQFLNIDPKIFTLNHIMKPIIQIWCNAAKERGILLEMHGQNTLLEFDHQFFPTRIVYRDLDLYIDPEIRKANKLHTDFPKTHLFTENREKIYSLLYDSFIGHHLFDYLTNLLEQFYQIEPKEIQESCKETFDEFFPDAHLYFTKYVSYYSNDILPGKKQEIIMTDEVPKWR